MVPSIPAMTTPSGMPSTMDRSRSWPVPLIMPLVYKLHALNRDQLVMVQKMLWAEAAAALHPMAAGVSFRFEGGRPEHLHPEAVRHRDQPTGGDRDCESPPDLRRGAPRTVHARDHRRARASGDGGDRPHSGNADAGEAASAAVAARHWRPLGQGQGLARPRGSQHQRSARPNPTLMTTNGKRSPVEKLPTGISSFDAISKGGI